MINLLAYFSPLWTVDRCNHFIRYEHSMTTVGITIASIMMLIRIDVLYPNRDMKKGKWFQHHPVVWGVLFLLIVHVSVNIYLITRQVAVVHNPASGIHSCTGIFQPHLPRAESAASAYLILIYDTVVFILVLWKTFPSQTKYKGNAARILTALRHEAVGYFSVICVITLVNTLLISFAPEGIRNLLAQLQLLSTVAAMSRISIHLRKQASEADGKAHTLPHKLQELSFGVPIADALARDNRGPSARDAV